MRLLRQLHWLSRLWGGLRLMLALYGPTRFSHGRYLIQSEGHWFLVDPRSFVDWNLLFCRGYELDAKALFVGMIPHERRRTVLDVGANIGSHSLYFSDHFARVVAFEPNKAIFSRLTENVGINPSANVRCDPFGLGSRDEELTFYAPSPGAGEVNLGTGSFVAAQAPDVHVTETAQVRAGDRALRELAIDNVDAIKLDVQGFEVEVLRGLHDTLATNRPSVWIEVSDETRSQIAQAGGLSRLIPFSFRLYRFHVSYAFGVKHVWQLREYPPDQSDLPIGDWVIAPKP